MVEVTTTTKAAALAATRASAPRRKTRRLLRGLVGVLGLAAVIEIVSRLGIVNPAFLPPFSEVVVNAVGLLARPAFLMHVGATVGTYALGLAIAIVIAVPIGTIFGLSQPVYRSSRTLVELMRPVPPVALIPLVVLAVGSGIEMKLIVVVFAAVWPILFNTMYGVHDVDPVAKHMARSFGLTRGAVIRRVVIPSSAPFIVTGIRVASSIALIVVVTVELVAGGADGIGAFISRARAAGDAVLDVYAGTLMAGVIGLLINLGIGWAERRYFGWADRQEAAA
ncbi:nitrate ABC transporter permease [Pseudoclavibacter endophyticus]|uniref:ABC transporter permease n=1 Tax=Pseudoclavibacter endophyticus TaxID=1778590 RepID=A0A6H9WE80_9MICO|nr:ABC transporter permease [Pseudoclavibacter endophyticus]KAB1649189.1 ABC transporter permease [Pseudoclavibacter endophyticus]GGA64719.1 nitrate ABC transporter permease [Pseudoclavibacter endophyticus]